MIELLRNRDCMHCIDCKDKAGLAYSGDRIVLMRFK